MAKKSAVKSIKVKKLWWDTEWTVRFGSLSKKGKRVSSVV
jgi:hypothetical protein